MKEADPRQPQWGGHVSTQSYALGYVLSLCFILLAFFLSDYSIFSGILLGSILMILAFLQSWLQLVFFFNIGKEEKPRWSFWALFFTLFILAIVIIGSLFIMNSLNYRMMI